MKNETIGIIIVLGIVVVIGFMTFDNMKYTDDDTNITLIESVIVTEIPYNTTNNTTFIECNYDYQCLSIDPNTNKSVLNTRCINNTCVNVNCQKDEDCRYANWGHGKLILYSICENSTCISADCECNEDCRRMGKIYYVGDTCINNVCVRFANLCIEISKLDYNMTNPYCEYDRYYKACYCDDKIVDSPRQKIVNNNSIIIIEEKYHFSGPMTFYPKLEVIDKFIDQQFE